MNVQTASLPTGLLVVVVVLGLVQLTLDVVALVDLVRRPLDRVALGNKWVWVAIILLVNLLGAILYLAVGRRPAQAAPVPPPARQAPAAGTIADALYGPRPGATPPVTPSAPAPGPDDEAPRPGADGTEPR